MMTLVDGQEVFVHGLAEFDPARRPVILVHGAGCDHSVWRYQTRRLLAAGLGALAPDLPGHGRSGGEPLRSVSDMAGWLLRLIESLGVHRPILVGHSMGSLIALAAGARDRRIAGLVLVGTADRMAVHPDLLSAATAGEHVAVDLIVGWSVVGDQRLGGHPNPGTWTRAAIARLFEQNLSRNLGVDLHACNDHDPMVDAAAAECPVLVINGTADLMTPSRAAVRLAAAIRGAEMVAVEGGSHMAMYEHPRQVTIPMLSWIEAQVGAGGSGEPG